MTKTANTQTVVEATAEDDSHRMVTLDRLALSPMNPRPDVTEAEIDALAESIRTVGLLQNLAGIERQDGTVEIVAGGRRLRALQRIVTEDEDDPASFAVPVILARNELEARAWANTENCARRNLGAAQEVRAYKALFDTGALPDTIAKAFAVTVRHVKGRLRLANLPEPILDALRVEVITLDVAAAYTVTEDTKTQLDVFETLRGNYMANNPVEIKRRLMADTDDGDSTLARFVGREAYEAVGGPVREDLFGEDVYFQDTGLLAKLASEKLETAAARIKAEGWKWVETAIGRVDWSVLNTMGRVYPKPVEASEDESDRYDELAALVEDDEASDGEREEFEALVERFDSQVYSAAQRSHAGAIVSISYNGALEIERGLVKPEDRAAAVEAGVCRAQAQCVSAKPENKGPYSAALADDLAEVRTAAIQTALLAKPELALDLLTFALSTPVYTGVQLLGINTTRAENAPADDDGLTLHERLKAGGHDMPLAAQEAVAAFAAFRATPKKQRNAILTESVARILHADLAGDGANPFLEYLAQLAETQVRRVWTPTRALFKRLTGSQLEAIMAHILDRPVPKAFAKSKKAQKVERLHQLFTDDTARQGMTAEAKARIASWLPEGIATAETEPTDEAEDREAA